MATISEDEVRKLADLSAITLSDEQTSRLQTDLGNIIGYIEQLGDLDLSGVEPTYQVNRLENVDRDDVIIDYGVSKEQLLKNAPQHQDGYIKVPKVLGDE